MDITMKVMERMKGSPNMMNKDITHNMREVLLAQGETHWMMKPGNFPPDNPLTAKGEKVMGSMMKQYGKRGKQVFYASAQKGKIKGVHK